MMSDLDFINFKDIINENNFSKEWSIVTAHDDKFETIENNHTEWFFIYSKLVTKKQEYLDIEFSIPEWISGWEFLKECSENRASFEPRNSNLGDMIVLKEFFCKCGSNKIQIDKDFIETYALTPNSDETILSNNEEPIVKIESRKIIKIKTDYLRDYLDKNDSYMVRSFDCLRRIPIPPLTLIGHKRDEIPYQDYDKRLKVTIVEFKEKSTLVSNSRLLGKNVIFPQKLFGK
jgi:hypothetical protein